MIYLAHLQQEDWKDSCYVTYIIIADRNSEDSIDHNLDPKSTRSLSKLVVETGSLHETDYSKLAKMDFRYATDFVLIINRYF